MSHERWRQALSTRYHTALCPNWASPSGLVLPVSTDSRRSVSQRTTTCGSDVTRRHRDDAGCGTLRCQGRVVRPVPAVLMRCRGGLRWRSCSGTRPPRSLRRPEGTRPPEADHSHQRHHGRRTARIRWRRMRARPRLQRRRGSTDTGSCPRSGAPCRSSRRGSVVRVLPVEDNPADMKLSPLVILDAGHAARSGDERRR
jgi:hypothetical protein